MQFPGNPHPLLFLRFHQAFVERGNLPGAALTPVAGSLRVGRAAGMRPDDRRKCNDAKSAEPVRLVVRRAVHDGRQLFANSHGRHDIECIVGHISGDDASGID